MAVNNKLKRVEWSGRGLFYIICMKGLRNMKTLKVTGLRNLGPPAKHSSVTFYV
jgi:hypothetical protein